MAMTKEQAAQFREAMAEIMARKSSQKGKKEVESTGDKRSKQNGNV